MKKKNVYDYTLFLCFNKRWDGWTPELLLYCLRAVHGTKYSTIENEKNNNPRLKVSSPEEYAAIMNNLNIEIPTMINIAVPANKKGITLDQL